MVFVLGLVREMGCVGLYRKVIWVWMEGGSGPGKVEFRQWDYAYLVRKWARIEPKTETKTNKSNNTTT